LRQAYATGRINQVTYSPPSLSLIAETKTRKKLKAFENTFGVFKEKSRTDNQRKRNAFIIIGFLVELFLGAVSIKGAHAMKT
jgi:hypothetical protein